MTAVRSGTGTLQVTCTAVRSGAEIDLLFLGFSVSQGVSFRGFPLAPACKPHREGMGGLPQLGSETDEGVAKDNSRLNWKATLDSGCKVQRAIPLGYRFNQNNKQHA